MPRGIVQKIADASLGDRSRQRRRRRERDGQRARTIRNHHGEGDQPKANHRREPEPVGETASVGAEMRG